MTIIEVKNLTYTYSLGTPFEKKAVDNISLSIEKGSFIGIAGHTGSGKSTFIQQLNGLIKPSSGKVFVDGSDIWLNKNKLREVRFKVGLVFQFPEYQLFEESVYKDISFGPKNMGLSDEEIKTRVINAANFTGLDLNLLQKSPFELSGGEKRRAAIAGIIAMDPEVLILDEPTAGLDPLGKKKLLYQIKQYHQQKKNTVIIVSHNMEDIAENCDKVLVMKSGKSLMFDTPRKVFSNIDSLNKASLKTPQITEIMWKLKKIYPQIPDGILTVDEAYNEIMNLVFQKEENYAK